MRSKNSDKPVDPLLPDETLSLLRRLQKDQAYTTTEILGLKGIKAKRCATLRRLHRLESHGLLTARKNGNSIVWMRIRIPKKVIPKRKRVKKYIE